MDKNEEQYDALQNIIDRDTKKLKEEGVLVDNEIDYVSTSNDRKGNEAGS